MEDLSEIEKAKQLLAQEEEAKKKEFLEKYQALCQEYGFHIEAVVNLSLFKNQ